MFHEIIIIYVNYYKLNVDELYEQQKHIVVIDDNTTQSYIIRNKPIYSITSSTNFTTTITTILIIDSKDESKLINQ